MFDTFSCNICGDERPNASISVRVRELVVNGVPVPHGTYNERYCNDRPDCIAAAAKPGPHHYGSPDA